MKRRFDWKTRWAVVIGLAVTIYIVLADCVFLPLHEGGYHQTILGYINGLSAVLQFPGFCVVQYTSLRPGHHTTTAVWLMLVPINFVLWVVGWRVLLALMFPGTREVTTTASGGAETVSKREMQTATGLTSAKTVAKRESIAAAGDRVVAGDDVALSTEDKSARGVSRRQFVAQGVRVAAAGGAVLGAYTFVHTPRDFGVSRRTQPIRGLRSELDGLRIVQLTDIHHGPNLSLEYVREVVRATNALNPDLILLTGDYVYRSSRYIEPVVRELAELRGRVGVVGVLGNHDWWEDADLTRKSFAQAGIPLIDNSRLFVSPDRKLVRDTDEGLCVAGVGDYLEDVVRFDDALGGVKESMPRILLSHNPDSAEDSQFVQMRPRVDLMFCGHTHGGQVWFPLVGAMIVPSRYGQKYASGLVKGPVCDVYVSRGIGTTILPMRFCVPPEIAVTELRTSAG